MSDDISAPAIEHVADHTRRAMSWNLIGAVATNVMRLLVVAVLGRALDSTDFGIVATAISVNALLYSVRDLGVGQALVQQRDIDRGHIATTFSVSTYLGFGISALLVVTAPLVSALYRIPESVNVIRVVGLLFLVRGLSIASRTLLQRAMNFRLIASIDTVSFIIGSSISMVLAVGGMGPWSLVAGYLTEETLSTVLYLIASPPSIAIRIDRGKLADLMRFGTGQTVSQIAATLATYGDNFVVGSALGPTMLGYYTRAYELIRFPSAVFDNIVGNVLFPAFSRFQDDEGRLSVSFRRAMFANALLLLPGSALLIVAAPEAIRVLMGRGWDTAVLPFQILSVTMMMRTSAKVGAAIAGAAGRIRAVAIVNSFYMVFVIGGAALAIPHGIVGVSFTTALAIAFVFFAFSYLGLVVSRLPIRQLIAAHVPGLAIAIVVGGCDALVVHSLRGQMPSAVVLLCACIATLVIALVMIALWMRGSVEDFMWLRAELARITAKLRAGRQLR